MDRQSNGEREMTYEEMKKRLDELASQYAKTHDEGVKAQIETLSLRLNGAALH